MNLTEAPVTNDLITVNGVKTEQYTTLYEVILISQNGEKNTRFKSMKLKTYVGRSKSLASKKFYTFSLR